jgi:hypothetical protein
MKLLRSIALLSVLFVAAPGLAAAQDASPLTSMFAAGVEAFGQSLGESMTSGSSIFVTATGHANLPSPLTDAYLVNIEGRSASAVEAQHLRDQRLQAARAAAAKFGVTVEVGSTAFTHENDPAAQQRRRNQATAERLAHPGVPVVEPVVADERVFVARTGVRFRAADPQRLPAFLDALQAAGVDSPSGNLGAVNTGFAGILNQSTQVLGFGSAEQIDPALWDHAGQEAIADARRQASILAAAAGRTLGEARQVLVLTRSVQGSTASVTVAVRYAFAH